MLKCTNYSRRDRQRVLNDMTPEIQDYIEVRIHSKLQADNVVLREIQRKVECLDDECKDLNTSLKSVVEMLKELTDMLK